MVKLLRGYSAPSCGKITKAVARLLSLLWQVNKYKARLSVAKLPCGEVTCYPITRGGEGMEDRGTLNSFLYLYL